MAEGVWCGVWDEEIPHNQGWEWLCELPCSVPQVEELSQLELDMERPGRAEQSQMQVSRVPCGMQW